MPDTNPQQSLDTSISEFRLNRFEGAWLAWRAGNPPPDWRQHLPADGESCSSDLIFSLLQMDIEYRVKAGMSALLAEQYFEHPRLQRDDVRLDLEQQVELIRWEYQQRWKKGDPANRADYEAAFPRLAEAVREFKPQSRCPRCHKVLTLEETSQTLCCLECDRASPLIDDVPPAGLDLRNYELIEPVNKGGMGEVYRCCDPALGRDLAIKVMRAELLSDPEFVRRFLREARITGSLQHPGIVPVHNLGRLADGRLHYTMRLLSGGQTFAGILKEEAGKSERLPYLLSIFEKICQAVAYAHSKRVIHRDLKPHNVMVGRFGEVQVLDWGLAKLLTAEDAAGALERISDEAGTSIPTEAGDTSLDLTRAGSGFGSPPYMPPEQALGQWNLVDERADVFSLGAILCEVLTGKPVYTGHNRAEVEWKAKRGDVREALERLERCGAEAALIALCRECLSPHLEDRPHEAAAVAKRVAQYQAEVQERLRQAELERVAAQTRAREEQARAAVEVERTREAQARVKAERRAKRRLLALSLAIGTILCLGSGGGWWITRERLERLEAESLVNEARNHVLHGDVLYNKGQMEEAIAEYRKAIQLQPDVPDYWDTLASVLYELKRWDEAISAYETLTRLKPSYAVAFHDLGDALNMKDLTDQAIAAYKEAIRLEPDYADAHDDLGDCLREKGLLDEAIAEYRIAIRCKRDFAFPHNGLAVALCKKGQHDAAIAEYRKAIKIKPDDPAFHDNLGDCLREKGLQDEAIAEYRIALQLKPDEDGYHNGLGLALYEKSQYDQAIAAYREAIRLNPEKGIYHCNLGNALRRKGQLDEAFACFQESARLKSNYAYAHSGMGLVLIQKERYAEARKSFQRAVQLFSQDDLNRPVYIQYLQDCDRFAGLEKKLPAILSGQEKPGDAEEAIALATLCRFQLRWSAAARLYADAFKAEPRLAANLEQQYRYFAACCAASAASQSEDGRLLSSKEVAMFRRWALGWLCEDLLAYTTLAQRRNPAQNQKIQKSLLRWRRDSDLAIVRESQVLDHLPDNERTGWQSLWHDVDELLLRIAREGDTKPVQKRPKP